MSGFGAGCTKSQLSTLKEKKIISQKIKPTKKIKYNNLCPHARDNWLLLDFSFSLEDYCYLG